MIAEKFDIKDIGDLCQDIELNGFNNENKKEAFYALKILCKIINKTKIS